MYTTLGSLVERAITGNQRPLEFYLRDQSRLPGPRANLELVSDFSDLLATVAAEQPEQTRGLLKYLINGTHTAAKTNTPEEFVLLCGVVAYGACAETQPTWRTEAFEVMGEYAEHASWRVREGAVMGFQRLLIAAPQDTIRYLKTMAARGNDLRQRAAIAAIAEPPLLKTDELVDAALAIQRTVLERLRCAPSESRRREPFRTLRQALGYTLSVVTAAAPERGFALMRECAGWGDPDVTWVLRENIKKKRLAKFPEDMEALMRLLA
ncbi:MAG TPA: hypothetical protein VKV40_23190 [Ktedonobacteraceae bacterium]|nr:hypothetical protein [Ktedonobacteraceae bacterium]